MWQGGRGRNVEGDKEGGGGKGGGEGWQKTETWRRVAGERGGGGRPAAPY